MYLGELLVLKWSDIDYNNATISISKTLYNPNRNTLIYDITTPNTKGFIRVIDIEPELIVLLKSNLECKIA